MSAKFSLEIKTPEKLLFSGEIESLIVQHPLGKEGYLAFHEPVLKELAPGKIQFFGEGLTITPSEDNTSGITKGETKNTFELFVDGGFISFENNKAILFIR